MFTVKSQWTEFQRIPNACARVRCASGYRCEIYKPTGEAFCNPDCKLNNGGCHADQTCKLEKVQCIRAPCPPVVKCTDKGELVCIQRHTLTMNVFLHSLQ